MTAHVTLARAETWDELTDGPARWWRDPASGRVYFSCGCPAVDCPYANGIPSPGGGKAIGGLDAHTIHDDGRVTPSILLNRDGCGWHVFGTLADWSPR